MQPDVNREELSFLGKVGGINKVFTAEARPLPSFNLTSKDHNHSRLVSNQDTEETRHEKFSPQMPSAEIFLRVQARGMS